MRHAHRGQVITAGGDVQGAADRLAVRGFVAAARQAGFVDHVQRVAGRRVVVQIRVIRVDGLVRIRGIRRHFDLGLGVRRHIDRQGGVSGVAIGVGDGVVDHHVACHTFVRREGHFTVRAEVDIPLAGIGQSGRGQGRTVGTLIVIAHDVVYHRLIFFGGRGVIHGIGLGVLDADIQAARRCLAGIVLDIQGELILHRAIAVVFGIAVFGVFIGDIARRGVIARHGQHTLFAWDGDRIVGGIGDTDTANRDIGNTCLGRHGSGA